jgi:hypothetical protein
MKRNDATLEKIYEKDPSTNSFIIAVAIEKYTDIFNELDPAPFKSRDLNHELRVYLEDSSADIPFKYSIILQFNVLDENQDLKREERITFGLKTYFSFVQRQFKRQISEDYQKSVFYVGIAFILLLAAYSLRNLAGQDIIASTALEGVTIGGWVFLWEAISTFAFKNREVKSKNKHYKRFMGAQIRFNYVSKS